MRSKRLFFLFVACQLATALAACQPAVPLSSSKTPTEGVLVPYLTATATLTPNLTILPTDTLQPTLTPTPRVYTVKQGDTLSTIAWAYGINLLELEAANPTVDPLALKPGMTLVLPEAKPVQNGTQAVPSATPVPVTIDPPVCYPALDGSAWCFALVHNSNSFAVENVTANIRLSFADSSPEVELTAITPLDVIAPAGFQALAVHFPAPVGSITKASVTLLTSIPVVGGDTRYISAKIDSQQVNYSTDGKMATISGNVILDGSRPARLTWVAATAIDASGNIVGVRRWDYSTTLQPQTALPFSINIYSMSGEITRVDLQVEARP